MIALESLTRRRAHLGEVFEPQSLGERIIDRHVTRRGDRLQSDGELRRLSGEFRFRIGLRERHRNRPRLCELHALDLILKPRNEGARAEHEIDIIGSAAVKHLAVERTDEIDRGLVALFGDGGRAFLRRIGPVSLGNVFQRAVDVLFRNVRDQPLNRDVVERAYLKLRQDFDSDDIGKVRLGLEGLL